MACLEPDSVELRRAAVFHHAVTVLSFDAPMLKQIEKNSGKLEANTLKQIAAEYKVARTLSVDQHEALKNAVNTLASQTKDSDLGETAAACIKVAEGFVQRVKASASDKPKERERIPLSAVSKLLWFARPGTGWTLYDSFTCRALKVRGHARRRFQQFYTNLNNAGFERAVSQLQAKLEAPFDGVSLYPERIIDAQLVLIGAPNCVAQAQLVERAKAIEATLPETLRKPLADFADKSAEDDRCWLELPFYRKTRTHGS